MTGSELHGVGVRTMSVLFTDLVGSTEHLTRVGDEAWDRIRHRHFDLLRRAVDVHRGREVKTLGDGLMAVFDSGCDAVSCATAMQRAVHDEGLHHPFGPTPIRVGVSSGDVAVEGDDCFGVAVVESSRLCAAAEPAEILASDVVRFLTRGRGHTFSPRGPVELKGFPEPTAVWTVAWDPTSRPRLRAVLADDAVLVREGIARLLEGNGIRVVAQAGDAEELLRYVESERPDVVITDVRMPPTGTVEGLEAAIHIRRRYPDVAVLVLSQHLERRFAQRLLETGSDGVGYLLKERVGDVDEFVDLVRRLTEGEAAMDPEFDDDQLARR